jgi:MerC mercury resistance protein
MGNRNRLHWLTSTGGILALLAPKGLCPICVAASGGVLSSIGLGFLAVDGTIRWVLPLALALGLFGLFFASRAHRRWWVFALGVAGSAVLYGAWLAGLAPILYSGMAVLIAASVFNFWSQRHPRVALVQIGTERTVQHGEA